MDAELTGRVAEERDPGGLCWGSPRPVSVRGPWAQIMGSYRGGGPSEFGDGALERRLPASGESPWRSGQGRGAILRPQHLQL